MLLNDRDTDMAVDLFWGLGWSIKDISEYLKCSVYSLSPWLYQERTKQKWERVNGIEVCL